MTRAQILDEKTLSSYGRRLGWFHRVHYSDRVYHSDRINYFDGTDNVDDKQLDRKRLLVALFKNSTSRPNRGELVCCTSV